MGLDQYLYKRGEFAWDRLGEEDFDYDYGGELQPLQVGYWRKANHIHKWFVDKAQGGVDDCRCAPISAQDLQELRSAILAILEDPDRAAELLPRQTGFFFGSCDYDEGYEMDLKYTVQIISAALADPDPGGWIYQSSW